MPALSEWLQEVFGLSEMMVARIAASLLAVILLWLVRRLILSVVWRRADDVRVRYRWRKTTTYVLVPIGLLIVGRIWFEGIGRSPPTSASCRPVSPLHSRISS